MQVTVKRSEWGRGQCGTEVVSALYNGETTKRCCLGFVGNACGYSDVDMRDVASPGALALSETLHGPMLSLIEPTRAGHLANNELAYLLMHVNDDNEITDSDRETTLITHGLKVDIQFTFVD